MVNGITMNFMERAKSITTVGNNYKEISITHLLKTISPIGFSMMVSCE